MFKNTFSFFTAFDGGLFSLGVVLFVSGLFLDGEERLDDFLVLPDGRLALYELTRPPPREDVHGLRLGGGRSRGAGRGSWVSCSGRGGVWFGWRGGVWFGGRGGRHPRVGNFSYERLLDAIFVACVGHIGPLAARILFVQCIATIGSLNLTNPRSICSIILIGLVQQPRSSIEKGGRLVEQPTPVVGRPNSLFVGSLLLRS